MNKFIVLIIAVSLIGCASMRNTINRIQSDLEYFDGEILRYSVMLGDSDSKEARDALKDAKKLLFHAYEVSYVGDKLAEKKYLSALVDIMDILIEHEESNNEI
jgi:hypothetical protein